MATSGGPEYAVGGVRSEDHTHLLLVVTDWTHPTMAAKATSWRCRPWCAVTSRR
jgi:hypothetical protein